MERPYIEENRDLKRIYDSAVEHITVAISQPCYAKWVMLLLRRIMGFIYFLKGE